MGITLFHFGRVPVRLHWSVLLGLAVFSGFHFDPIGWLGVLALILVHEAGHALVVKWAGGRATAIELTGFGGLCRWEGDVSPIGRAAIAWGGIWGQLVVLAVAMALPALGAAPDTPAGFHLWSIATNSNVWMIAFNLLPFSPLDGAEAWPLPLLLGRRVRASLSAHRDVAHAPGEPEDDDFPQDSAQADQARALANRLLDAAREPEDRP